MGEGGGGVYPSMYVKQIHAAPVFYTLGLSNPSNYLLDEVDFIGAVASQGI